ncbi:MAG: hypothetical protein R3E32_10475 [Chitinophagales bacterium]
MIKSKSFFINVLRLIFFISFLQSANAQTLQIERCGTDNQPLLNECEVEYFNTSLKENRGEFDFEGKRIAFAEGNWGANLSSKNRYFEVFGKPRFEQNGSVANQLIVLTEAEKEVSPEYDAIIVSWSKVQVQNKRRAKLIKRFCSANP